MTVAIEHALLGVLHSEGMAVPRPRMLLSSDTMVMDWVEGTTDLPSQGPTVMAKTLVAIHAYRGKALCLLPPREDPLPVVRRALAEGDMGEHDAAFSDLEKPDICLLHGDFWPGNLMWREGELAAVLDWEDAAVGDPLSDVACARVELAVAAGEEASLEFRSGYFESTKHREKDLLLWEIYVATTALDSMNEWGLLPHDLAHRRAVTKLCQERAIARLRES